MDSHRIIASLTTYPARIRTIRPTLISLLNQQRQPDCVELWVSESEFARPGQDLAGRCQIPDDVMDLVHDGSLTLCWSPCSYGSHDKYLWTMKAHPESIVMTFDDDLTYDAQTISRLLEAHRRYPSSIIASRSHRMTFIDGELAPYKQWDMEQRCCMNEPRFDLMATSGAGTLYPPYALPAQALQGDSIDKACEQCDDIWLLAWGLMAGRSVVAVGDPSLSYVDGTQDVGLFHENIEGGGNDRALSALRCRYALFDEKMRAVACESSRNVYQELRDSQRDLTRANDHIHRFECSRSWRIGRFVTYLPRRMRRIVRARTSSCASADELSDAHLKTKLSVQGLDKRDASSQMHSEIDDGMRGYVHVQRQGTV